MRKIGSLLIFIGFVILLLIFLPVIKEEIRYRSEDFVGIKYSLDANSALLDNKIKEIIPVDKEFGIVIPKININAKIFPDVDPTNPNNYLSVLKKGVAHSKGSSYPGQDGNVFLFAHSTDAFWNVGQYNAVFFLIGKLEKGDEVDIYYQGKLYKYNVLEKKVVAPEILEEYVRQHTLGKTLTLQTCYPPGTTLKRLIVIAKEFD